MCSVEIKKNNPKNLTEFISLNNQLLAYIRLWQSNVYVRLNGTFLNSYTIN